MCLFFLEASFFFEPALILRIEILALMIDKMIFIFIFYILDDISYKSSSFKFLIYSNVRIFSCQLLFKIFTCILKFNIFYMKKNQILSTEMIF